MDELRTRILDEIRQILKKPGGRDDKLAQVCRILAQNFPYYNWVGFYIAIPDREELVLGPFVGAPTEHTKIPYGRGICGQAAVKLDTVVVEDVSRENNYLACSPEVKSEIVVPVFAEGKFVAELDIDSHIKGAFSPEDEKFLRKVCEYVAELF